MDQNLKTIFDFIQQNENLTADEKNTISKAVKDVDKELSITAFKLERTEKVKRTTAILLEETIEELEQKRGAVEAQNRELEIEAALEKVRSKSLAMHHSEEIKEVVKSVFEKMKELGFFHNNSVMIVLPKNGFREIVHWTFNENFETMEYNIPAFNHRVSTDPAEAWSKGEKTCEINLNKEEKDKFLYQIFTYTDYSKVPEEFKKYLYSTEAYSSFEVFEKHCALLVDTFTSVNYTEEQKDLVKRFAKVFEQAYIRFLDLQKAEAQAREAKIEAALERVRSRSMAMYKSDELQEVINTVLDRIKELEIETSAAFIMIHKNGSNDYESWIQNDEHNYASRIVTPFHKQSKLGRQGWESIINGRDSFSNLHSKEEKNEWFAYMFEHSDFRLLPESRKKYILDTTALSSSIASIKNGAIGLYRYSDKVFSDQENDILKRFAKVFEQAYVRFLDLQKAEAQAREAQIEASLERIRAKSMAMHHSSELAEAAQLLYQQFHSLGIKTYTCAYMFIEEEKNRQMGWTIASDGTLLPELFEFPITGDSILDQRFQSWKDRQPIHEAKLHGEDNKRHHEFLVSLQPPEFAQHIVAHLPDQVYFYNANFLYGYLFIVNNESFTPEEKDIAIRFAKVFEQTYTRFLDLQKAEVQAREAQIELGLERVRARAMAMQKSDELSEVAALLFKQISELGIKTWTTGFNVWSEDENSWVDYITSPQGNIIKSYTIDATKFRVFMDVRDAKKRGDEFWVQYLEGELLRETYRKLSNFGAEKQYEKMLEDGFEFPSRQYGHFVFGSKASLMLITYESVPEAHGIFIRFGKVFEQTYIRFLDLQKAEAQAREAIKQASLDRVRGEIASMRTSEDLNRITPLIWRELKTLNVPFIRCGVFIIGEEDEKVKVYLTTPEGKALGVMNLSFDANELTKNTVESWRKKHVLKAHWNKEDFIEWTKSMLKLGQIQNAETYQGSETAPEFLNLHFVPFRQGMLYVGNTSPLEPDDLQLVKSLAESFSIAYARYEDFRQLEVAKNQIEKTFTELKAAQSRLIQSEKMASLGELTAGIAHEIQNPLNFVNNFSELSNELMDEMNEELDKGDIDEAKAIASDIKQNLEKINHHGKRAADIVKGMLQHSRTSSGQKEPTDINALADEYLRLAYHGLRAKDKSFNAKMITDFDETIGNINIVPQDIGRVILNLITNAFYVVDEKKKQNHEGYEPTVTVSTKLIIPPVGGMRGASVSVRDNGPGIPPHIIDKIFQPFFTTKPTGQGTGLGLSLAYDIVKAHGGELKVETKEGEGSTFIIHLPINSL